MSLEQSVETLFIRLSRHRRVDGLWLGILGTKKDDILLDRVAQALHLIRHYDPPRYARLKRDLTKIWIAPLVGARGQFRFAAKRCNLDYPYVKSATAESIASTIVHEATHAHPCLKKFGYPEALQPRIERICMRQQQAFARKLPPDDAITEELEAYLAIPASFWSNPERAARQPAQQLTAARDAGLPDWLTKFLQKLGTPTRRR